MFLKASPWRSVTHRKNVAALACVNCGAEGMTQAAHRNEGKGMAIKACDSQLMALCVTCHSAIDQGGKYPKATRREMERGFVDFTRNQLIARGQWPVAAERAYEKVNGPVPSPVVVTPTPSKEQAMDLQKLTQDCIEAREQAITASKDSDDGGTANLDAVFLKLPKYSRAQKVVEAVKCAGLHASDTRWMGRGVMIQPPGDGQGNQRSTSQEAMFRALQKSGWEVLPYYQMD